MDEKIRTSKNELLTSYDWILASYKKTRSLERNLQMHYNKNTLMEQTISALKKTARVAGLLYFIFAITAVYGFMYVYPKIMVPGDTVATVKNMLANEFLFRTGIAGGMITHTLFVFVVLFLYRLFKHVNEHQAKLMVALNHHTKTSSGSYLLSVILR